MKSALFAARSYIGSMCGIVGYTGYRNAVDVVFKGLKALEYRGYDSAGIATECGKISVYKSAGRVQMLKSKLPASPCHTAIGHTRWATHGKPLTKNAHPHLSFDGKIAVVHNGIIENYKELKADLTAKGITFASDTDSEVVAHLLALEKGDFLQAVAKVAGTLKGAATFLAIRENDDNIYCSKRGTSLAIGVGDGESFVASDTLAICEYLTAAIPLEDGDVAVVSKNGVNILNSGATVKRQAYCVARTMPSESECFMRSEIDEIPQAVTRTVDEFFCTDHRDVEEKIRCATKLCFVGCGTAYHAALYGKQVFSHLLHKTCEAVESSEFDDTQIDKDTVAVFISQSGETADTVLAARKCVQKGGTCVAICNVHASLITFVADATYYTNAGAEVAVAATKSYVCQLLVLYMLAKRCAGENPDASCIANLTKALESATKQTLFTPTCLDKNLFFIGKGQDIVTAKEAALKVKEITCKMTDSYPAGELKHGPIALIDDKSLAVVVATNEQDKARIEATTSELRSRGATVFAVSGIGDLGADKTVYLPPISDELLSPIVAVVPLQNLALELSLAHGLNPDKPRNLAKSVTVI